MSPIEYALLIWDSAHQRPRKKETGMCSLVVKKFEHFHVQRVQRPPVWSDNKATTGGHEYAREPTEFLLFSYSVTFLARHDHKS